jgi:hypothetical protein
LSARIELRKNIITSIGWAQDRRKLSYPPGRDQYAPSLSSIPLQFHAPSLRRLHHFNSTLRLLHLHLTAPPQPCRLTGHRHNLAVQAPLRAPAPPGTATTASSRRCFKPLHHREPPQPRRLGIAFSAALAPHATALHCAPLLKSIPFSLCVYARALEGGAVVDQGQAAWINPKQRR